ncbi:hypothetical protein [Galbibacter sp. BG1]
MLLEPQKSEKAIKAFSWRVMKRLCAAGDGGRAFSMEDIQQELRIAWVKASQAYSPELGVPFQAYLLNGMRLHINRVIEKHIERRHNEVIAMSLDASMSNSGDKPITLADAIADETIKEETDFEEDQHFKHAIRRLKPRAQLFITLLREQPEELLNEVIRMKKKAEYARDEMGMTASSTNRLTAWMIFDLMDAPNPERTEIMKEIRALGERMCEVMSR